jgi:phenylacetic acid degradation operon negative regulatory protein
MVERGELAADDGVYELAGPLRRRQPTQDWSIAPTLGTWEGEWLLGIVGSGARTAAERSALRDAAGRLRMVELRDGVWCRPDNLPRAAAPSEAWETADAQCSWWRARPEADDVTLATRLFVPGAWADRARMLERRLRASTGAVRDGDGSAIADAFLVGAATLAHVRADPLLPSELCGRNWPGGAVRNTYREFQAAFSDALRDWFRTR